MDLIHRFTRIVNDRDISGAIDLQMELRQFVIVEKPPRNPKSICAFDISYDKRSRTNFGAAIMMSLPELNVIETATVVQEAHFPYVPGLLAFREGPAIFALFKMLKRRPEILLFDGHGLAHPRRMGIATVMGILLDKPSIGCGKSRLVGEYAEPDRQKGARSPLKDKDRTIGCVLRARDNIKPLFVSIGHGINLEEAVGIVLGMCRRYRQPEPIRAAHKLANEIRTKYINTKT